MVLLLDVMDTLVHDPFFVEVLEFFDLSEKELAASKDTAAWVAFEHGIIDQPTYLARFFLDRRPFDHRGLLDCLMRSYRWLEGIEPLLAELRAIGHPMHALSNYPIWYQMIEERLGLARYLEWSFVSCRTGVRKPAPEAFFGAAAALGVDPGECLFVDDRARNCEVAQQVGMVAIRFVDAARLRAELVRRALL